MPGKVQIVIEAQTAEALKEVQKFARGAQDAFDKVRAGDPILQSSAVKVTQLKDGSWQATGALRAFAQEVGNLPGPLGAAASAAQRFAGYLAGPAGVAAGVGAAAAAVATLGHSFAGAIQHLDNLSVQTGFGVASLQALQQAAKEAGEEPETLVRAFGKLNQTMAEVLMGNETAAATYRMLGIDLAGLMKQGKSTEQVFDQVARAVVGIADPTQRAAIQMELFGLRGRGVVSILDTIAREGLPGLQAGMREAGIVTSEEANRAAREWKTAADEMERTFTGLLNRVKEVAVQMTLAIVGTITSAQRGLEKMRRETPGMGWEGFGIGVEGMGVGGPSDVMHPGRGITGETGPRPRTVLGPSDAELREAAQAAFDAMKERLKPLEAEIKHLGEMILTLGSYWETGFGMASEALVPLMTRLTTLQRNMGQWGADWVRAYAKAGDTLSVVDTVVAHLEEDSSELGRTTLELGKGIARTAEDYKLVTPEAKKLDDLLVKLGVTAGGIDEAMAEGVQHAKPILTDFAQFTEAVANEIKEHFADVLVDGMNGNWDEMLRSAERHLHQLQQLVAEQITRNFGKLLGTEGVGSIKEMWSQFSANMQTTSGDVAKSFALMDDASQNTAQTLVNLGAVTVAYSAQLMASLLDLKLTSAGARRGQAIGTEAGTAIGSIWGQGAAGGIIGGAIGSLIGSIFDQDKLSQEAQKMRKFFQAAVHDAFTDGIKTALESGDVEAGWAVVKDRLKSAITDAVIEGLIVQNVIKYFVEPLADAIGEAMNRGLGPQAFRDFIAGPLADFKDKMGGLREIFGEIFDIMREDIVPAIDEATGTTSQWTRETEHTRDTVSEVGQQIEQAHRQALEPMTTATEEWLRTFLAVGGSADELRAILEAMPRDIRVDVTEVHHREDIGGLQTGGWVHGGTPGRDSVPRLLEPGEFVVNAMSARRYAPTLEAINAGGTTRPGGDDEDRRLMREQNVLLRAQNQILTDLARVRRARGSI